MAVYLYYVGPLSAMFHVADDFNQYKSGIYDTT